MSPTTTPRSSAIRPIVAADALATVVVDWQHYCVPVEQELVGEGELLGVGVATARRGMARAIKAVKLANMLVLLRVWRRLKLML